MWQRHPPSARQRARAGLRGRLRPLLARAEEGEAGPVRVPRLRTCVEQIEWKHSVLTERLGREDFRKELERHARDMRLKVRVRCPARGTQGLGRGGGGRQGAGRREGAEVLAGWGWKG